MNLQMTTTQKVAAAFVGMAFLAIGLGIIGRLIDTHYTSNQKNCTVSTTQSAQVKEEGLTSIDEVVCGSTAKK